MTGSTEQAPAPKSPKPANFYDFSLEELGTAVESLGDKKFRAKQLYKWIYKKGVVNPDEFSDVSLKFKKTFTEAFHLSPPEIVEHYASTDGSYKLVHELADKKRVETVLMKHDGYFTICVSSQVGCAMGCTFCVTGTMGLKRNLVPSEIVGQVVSGKRFLAQREIYPLRNIVFMGMGEPFHNYGNVTKSLDILLDPLGLDFSGRRVTVSTSGLTDNIQRFLTDYNGINLAISLNAVTQEERKKIMPISGKFPLEGLVKVCRMLSPALKRRITFEYIMLKGVNDTLQHAALMVKLLNGIRAKINLIPYNMNSGLGFERSLKENLESFQRFLLDKGLVATIRYSKGQDINAACGQLVNRKKAVNE